jgi:tRNA pseudouridine32 synthase
VQLVVSKPPSMPTHACGSYRHNSLHSVLRHMRPDIEQLNIVHRLDRLTSGIVILAKTAAKAKELALCIGAFDR